MEREKDSDGNNGAVVDKHLTRCEGPKLIIKKLTQFLKSHFISFLNGLLLLLLLLPPYLVLKPTSLNTKSCFQLAMDAEDDDAED